MEIINFFLAPSLQKADLSLKNKFSNLFIAFKFTLFPSITLAFLLASIQLFSMYSARGLSITQTARKLSDPIALMSPLNICLYGVIIIPLFEELTFRGFFNLKKVSICLSIGCFSYILLRLVDHIHPDISLFERPTCMIVATIVFTASLIWINQFCIDFVHSNLTSLFYLSNFCFIIMHAFNFKLSDFTLADYLSLPVLLIPHFAASLSLSFLRVKNGLVWSCLFHALWNMIFFLPQIIKNSGL